MDSAEALKLLPEAYARALVLRARGATPADIADDLDIVVEAVPSLLRLAAAKLARLLAERPSQNGTDGLGATGGTGGTGGPDRTDGTGGRGGTDGTDGITGTGGTGPPNGPPPRSRGSAAHESA